MKVVSFFMVFFLFGCSSTSPQVNYYLLDSEPKAIQNKAALKTVQLNPIHLPRYLDQPQLVTRDNNQKLIIANYHSWADDMSNAIRRILVNDLNNSIDDIFYIESCQNCESLTISIEHFYPTVNGEVVLSGKYHRKKNNKNHHATFFLTDDLERDGYDHAVKKMRQLLQKLAHQINKDVSS